MPRNGRLGILVGGGPAPGINSVIGAATIRARLGGVEVLGIQDGFEHLIAGELETVRPLSIDNVSRIHFRGGSILGTSRANPTTDAQRLERVVRSLSELGIERLVTIGGDDTAYSALRVEEASERRLQVVHVPKTIDNDLDLPHEIDTFGFQTARHVGSDLVRNIMVDAATTSRWYFIVAMGRKTGHLALGIGKATGATLSLIPEEFGGKDVTLDTVVDSLVGSVLKRMSQGRRHGVAVVAEGVALSIREADLGSLEGVERDEHGHVRIAEVDIGEILKRAVRARLSELGVKVTIVSKNVGYELRCADPIPFDMEYTRDLGFCAAEYILAGGTGVMVSMQGDRFVPVPLRTLVDPDTGRSRVRYVDVASEGYGIARRYMIRLERTDFADPDALARLAAVAGVTPEEFSERFGYLADLAPPAVEIS
jgi:6-phosphofructokinase